MQYGGHHRLAVDGKGVLCIATQCHVQHGAALGVIQVVARDESCLYSPKSKGIETVTQPLPGGTINPVL